MKTIGPLLLILVVGAVLLFKNLGNVYFWVDEAETALVARTIGSGEDGFNWLPRAWDGRNLVTEPGVSVNCDQFNDDLVWTLSPWAMHYFAAAGFRIWGPTTFGGRFLFAMIGLAGILLLYWVGRLYTADSKTALLSAALLALNTPYLLHMRQCRYYGLLPFGFLLMLAGYRKLGRFRYDLLFLVGAIFLFYAQNSACLFTLLGFWIHFLLFGFERRLFFRFAAITIGIAALGTPWFLYSDPARVHRHIQHFHRPSFFPAIGEYLAAYNNHIFPFAILLAYPLLGQNRRILNLAACLFVPPILLVSYLLWPNPRYTVFLIPLLSLLSGLMVVACFRRKRILGFAVLGALLLFHGRAFLPFLYEITHDYDGPNEGIVEFLREHAGPDDFVFTFHNPLPIMFYTNLRMVGQITTSDPEARRRVEGLPSYLYSFKQADWIIERPRSEIVNPAMEYARAMEEKGGWRLTRYRVPYPDIPWENRPHFAEHKYRTQPVDFGFHVHRVTRR
ncbi:MAG: hypothetical protein ABIK65_13190 [Candidatus Eisenbacteria bacterium]